MPSHALPLFANNTSLDTGALQGEVSVEYRSASPAAVPHAPAVFRRGIVTERFRGVCTLDRHSPAAVTLCMHNLVG